MADFLLEIGCEEIPARMIDAAAAELGRRLSDVLARERLAPSPVVSLFSTPRRLAVTATGIASTQADVEEQITGPSVKVAFKDGQPTPAAHAFAKKVNTDISKLQRIATPKGEYLAATVVSKGRTASEILKQVLPKELASIYWPKSMYWRAKNERFVRPVRWLVALLDSDVVPLEFDGIRAGRQSSGHRTLGGAVSLRSPRDYEADLGRAAVIASRAEREQRIRRALDDAARSITGARWREDAALLDTVVNLTEFPFVVLGSFDREFLELPEEVLVTVMRDHQKYFALEDGGHKLLPHFLAVLNTDGDPEGIIRHGHERVLRARFNDARFFWRTDQKISLRDRVPLLKTVTFQKDLGSYYDKTLRVQHLASHISGPLKEVGFEIRPGVVHKAACLAKTDLTTELVKEFTELQGVVGGLYARVQELDPGLTPEAHRLIAEAIYDHYKPESMEDSAPRTIEGAVLSIADKADSIAGMFALGLQPSGSKDPFALRRQANGIVKTIADHKLPLLFSDLLKWAFWNFVSQDGRRFKLSVFDNVQKTIDKQLKGFVIYEPNAKPRIVGEEGEDKIAVEISLFFRDRISFYMRDILGYRYDIVNALLTADRDSLVDTIARAKAVSSLVEQPEFEAIALSFKRINNIIFKGEAVKWRLGQLSSEHGFNLNRLCEPAEVALYEAAKRFGEEFDVLRKERKYRSALLEIVKLRPLIDRFFDEVMVLAEDPQLRANRIHLLTDLYFKFSTIADFSEIVTESKESKVS